MTMRIVTDHGWPKASDGTDGNGFEAFKNERDYIAQSGKLKTTVAAMDWATREIGRLQEAKRRALAIADERGRENVAVRAAASAVIRALDQFGKAVPLPEPMYNALADLRRSVEQTVRGDEHG